MTDPILIKVTDQLTLDAGLAETLSDGDIRVTPPETPMFEQLVAWLNQQTYEYQGMNHWIESIGLTSLCLRWGTWLALPFDANRPLDPRATSSKYLSRLCNHEMRRINIEASWNVAQVLRILRDDEQGYLRLLTLAYLHLPNAFKRVTRDGSVAPFVFAPFIPQVHQLIAEAQSGVGRVADFPATRSPLRAIANAMINSAYRNGPIEDFHAGEWLGWSLDHSRFSPREQSQVLRPTVEKFSGILTTLYHTRPWDTTGYPDSLRYYGSLGGLVYPNYWSLDLQSDTIVLSE